MSAVVTLESQLRAFVLVAASFVATMAMASANELNDRLLRSSDSERKAILQLLVGDGCVATRVFFNGIAKRGSAKGRAFWSVACTSGRRYLVMIPPRLEDTRVIECEKLKALGLGSCFKKLKD